MLSKADSFQKSGGNQCTEKFVNDIEAISNVLYEDKTLSRLASSAASTRSRSVGKSRLPDPKTKPNDAKNNTKDSSDKEKKRSIWSWKGLKALTNVRNRRFNCCFSLIVHSIEGLPAFFDDVYLVVHWKRKDGEQMTRPVGVSQGVAEIGEQLVHSCSVYGTRSGSNNSAKYEAKHFLLYASVYNAPELDLGKHRVDLTRLLPLSLDELEEEKSSGKWMTSFKLSGKAKGATMNVSFGYVVVGNNSTEPCWNSNVPEIPSLRQTEKLMGRFDQGGDLSIRRVGSLPAKLSVLNQSEDIKDLHEVLPKSRSELCESVNVLYQKLGEEMPNASTENKTDANRYASEVDPSKLDSFAPTDAGDKVSETEWEISEFSVIERGIEAFTKEEVQSEENTSKVTQSSEQVLETDGDLDVVTCRKDDESISSCDCKDKENDAHSKESLLKELETALSYASELVSEGLDNDETDALDWRKGKSLSLDDLTDLVADDFLNMLGIECSPSGWSSESEPESPRERLLKQFENDPLANGGLLDFDIDTDPVEPASNIPMGSIWESISHDFHESSICESFREMPETEADTVRRTRSMALRLEDLETDVLMRDWGLNEKAFQHSPVDIPPGDLQKLPPLGEGLSPFVQTTNGGFLRAMNPSVFKNAENGGSLIMQVSSPMVVPAEMGSGLIDILHGLAAVGIEKLSAQAKKLMPLENITGKTIKGLLQHESDSVPNLPIEQKSVKTDSTLSGNDTEYVCLEDLAPLAMDKIEALSIEGLRIQSGMSDEDAHSNISTQSIGEFSTLKGKTLDVGGLKLMDIEDNGEDVDGLMGLSLTLDEWMRLDSGEINDDDLVSERTSKILAAHHATSLDIFRGRSKGEKRRDRGGKKYGLLANNFTVALMVQLHDPLRNYEPVGNPMLALVQVERVFVPPKPRIYRKVPQVTNSDDEDEDEDDKENENREEELVPQYKITEVHVAGLKTEPGKKKLWDSTNQQQSGSRWLLANGMGKKNKYPVMKSSLKDAAKNSGPASPTTTTVQFGDTLWSISARVHGTVATWKGFAALNPHIRNPNVTVRSK